MLVGCPGGAGRQRSANSSGRRARLAGSSLPASPPPASASNVSEKKGNVLEQENLPFLAVLLSHLPPARPRALTQHKNGHYPAMQQPESPRTVIELADGT